MSDRIRVALAQINPTVGDLSGNVALLRGAIADARDARAQLVIAPELAVTGYPPEDLLLKEDFLADARTAVHDLAADCREILALVGYPERSDDVYNACAVLADGAIQASYRKLYLPNYGVFDEQRYFQSGESGGLIELAGARVGVTICEDVWEPGPPLSDEALAGATLVVNLSASPYHAGKGAERERMLVQRARDNLCAVAFCNLVGGQDELVFDGYSLVVDHEGSILARAPQFAEHLLVCDIDLATPRAHRLRDARHRPPSRRLRPRVELLASLQLPPGPRVLAQPDIADPLAPEAEVYAALQCGLADYVEKNGFAHVVLGLSGGIDSALVACVAVDALGPDRVTVAIMPSPHSSSETQADARLLADNLGVERLELAIFTLMAPYDDLLADAFSGSAPDLTEENLQARIRGNLLMALSNKFGWLVLTTANKSELSVGYSTLYGDSAGGFAVIKDCPKTLVYRLVAHRNGITESSGPKGRADAHGELVPRSILERAPSAELRPDQRDADSLPPYEVLDPILEGYVEDDLGADQLIAAGHDAADVERVIALVDRAEYKRRQAPPGVRLSTKAFGRDRRMPITNRYGLSRVPRAGNAAVSGGGLSRRTRDPG
ncbi:MAG: NAD+ synthase [Solirubrobacteraceae bacterium]|nr:MAG: NAD+ synthase [Solirubrobacterales bacterium]